jgi:hypothetical protein
MVPMAEPRVRARSTRSACAAAVAAGRIGVVRALDPFRLRTQATDEASRSAALTYGAQPWAALCTLVETVDVTQGEFADAPPLPRDLRLAVLTALSIEGLVPPGLTVDAAALAPLKAELHRRFAARSDRGSWALVDSGHLIASQRPDVVVAAVREVIGR